MKRFILTRIRTLIALWDMFLKWIHYFVVRQVYDIDPTFAFSGHGIIFRGPGEIHAGARSHIGQYSFVRSSKNGNVFIGDDTGISNFVAILTTNADGEGDVIIGNNCWIGWGVYINQGVTIGDNCTIGAHSVVLSDIPPNSVAVGAPARVVKGRRPGGNHVEGWQLDENRM